MNIEKSLLLGNIMFFILIGMVMNLTVVIHNDSKMPVFFYSEEKVDKFNDSTFYLPFNKFNEVKYPLLGDIFGFEKRFIAKYSIGDMFIASGILMLLIVTTKDGIKILRRKYGTTTSNE